MRSIGKRNIANLEKIISEEYAKDPSFQYGGSSTEDRIKARVPAEWYDVWESAWSEIERLISDGISKRMYSK